jgi:RNA polymerase sigma-70 factor (ECF subfamily)
VEIIKTYGRIMDVASLTDEELMIRIGLRDQSAFRELVTRHKARVTGMAWRIMGSKADGEDVAQEAFARIWVNAPKWRPEGVGEKTAKLSTWLYRVVVNLCIDRKRRPVTEAIEAAEEVADARDDALTGMSRAEVSGTVAAAIKALPERQRVALVMCFYEGMSNIEAAKILNLSVGAVESLLVRARRTLKEKLAGLHAELAES